MEKFHGHRRHFRAFWFGVLSAGVVVMFCQLASGGLTPLRISHEPPLQNAKKDSMPHPSNILLNTMFDSPLKASPFHRTALDGTTLVKPVQIASPLYSSPLSATYHPRLRPVPQIVAKGLSKQKAEQGLPKICNADAQALEMSPVVGRRAAILGVAGTAMTPYLASADQAQEYFDLMMKQADAKEKGGDSTALSKELDEMEKQLDQQQKLIDTALAEKRAPPVFEESDDRSLRLAKHLKSIGATMYGAYWCSHCYDQKKALGKKAMTMLTYVECDKRSEKNNNALCKEKDIKGYPTWEIAGEFYAGDKSLEELEKISKAPLN